MPTFAARTPINVDRLARLLLTHPNQELVHYVVDGLSFGFHIGFTGPRDISVSSHNLPSSLVHEEFISEHLPPFHNMRCSGVGAVPKKNGRLRLIHHLSSPAGNSVNDHISREDFSLQYVRIDDAIDHIMHYGTSAFLFKLDIKSAFRIIPVHPDDWHLLGIKWRDNYYYDMVLPFGLRSSPAIFDSVASCIEWIMHQEFSIPSLLHYLDDFLCIAPNAVIANQRSAILLRAFLYLGIPLAEKKVEGPAPVLDFLGITLDCIRLECRLPDDKLTELRGLLNDITTRQSISQGELASVLGKLSFASRCYQHKHYSITLTEEALADLEWWRVLLNEWNGRSFFLQPDWTPSPDFELYTDASGAGWGAYHAGRWMQGKWLADQESHSIEWKELYAIRQLFFVCARLNCTVSAVHIAGANNSIADALSRFRMQEFRQLAPSARAYPDRPAQL